MPTEPLSKDKRESVTGRRRKNNSAKLTRGIFPSLTSALSRSSFLLFALLIYDEQKSRNRWLAILAPGRGGLARARNQEGRSDRSIRLTIRPLAVDIQAVGQMTD